MLFDAMLVKSHRISIEFERLVTEQ
uniref:Uncharacterized protein n=1 Tax=Anguilla anguilla TaxID=7936 RepID=A0A0E9VVA9_ANGAN